MQKLSQCLLVVIAAGLMAGCSGAHPKGTARYDNFDSVKVEQMVGNTVSRDVFAKTIVCLNARRESRMVTDATNTVITTVTNPSVITPVTNTVITFATNFQWTAMTNLEPAQAGLPAPVAGEAAAAAAAAAGETNVAAAVTASNTAPALGTNLTISVANNSSGAIAPNQRVANTQLVRSMNNQLTSRSNNLYYALQTNLVVTAETNHTVSFLTNVTVMSQTNQIITQTNGVSYDYFLYTEMVPPQDFTLAGGESLILLVDGVRHGFAPSTSGTAFIGRRGYTSNLYRVSPDVLIAIANAEEVKIRFKGANSVVERTMNDSSRMNFRKFITKYFVPAAPAEEKSVASVDDITHTTNH